MFRVRTGAHFKTGLGAVVRLDAIGCYFSYGNSIRQRQECFKNYFGIKTVE